MPNALAELSVSELKRAVEIKEQIDALQEELNGLLGGATPRRPGRPPGRRGRRRAPTAAGRARIAAAQRARWARQQGGEAPVRRRRRRRMSAAGRAAISAAAKARWAKAKAAGRSRL